MSKGHKKDLRSSRDKRSGKYVEQRKRTEANRLKRQEKLLSKGLFNLCYNYAYHLTAKGLQLHG